MFSTRVGDLNKMPEKIFCRKLGSSRLSLFKVLFVKKITKIFVYVRGKSGSGITRWKTQWIKREIGGGGGRERRAGKRKDVEEKRRGGEGILAFGLQN